MTAYRHFRLDQQSETSLDNSIETLSFNLYGICASDIPVYARGQLHKQNDAFVLKLAVRCRDRDIATLLAESIN